MKKKALPITFRYSLHYIFDSYVYDIFEIVTSGMWMNPGVPEMNQRSELENMAHTYGKFWCTWQVDRGKLNLFFFFFFLQSCIK
ncbi:putative Oil body-associated protein [Helianthus annuus]|nr:putative Oil body-associated protein [Helianthus annuus]KAJ0597528.1 putative Oil body-associated protein [Helianthus annuus]KAJ0758177.1 putative Oil body-associated protein [Helianthus annuus]